EVDDILAEVKQLNATILKPAQTVFWGGYSGYFSDPDGYIFEVAYNPFMDLNQNDDLNMPD
ncbi:MAG: VOC family protein, partial [Bacteroidia bacterium]|nr:VOC family protein [Bacteroidia bacterium]